jgi:predicted AAA+ superfamily ATPase
MNEFHFPEIVNQRNSYIKKVLPFIGKQLIKAFTGQRRVGKSYLLFQVMQHIREIDKNANILYINKEDLKFDSIKTYLDLENYIQKNKSKNGITYVFIDEIQDIIEFERALRSLVLDSKIDLYCTGSNANLLSGELSTVLSGRFIEITVYSLSFLEFIQFHKLENSESSIDLYLKYGGLPYIIHLPLNDEIVFEYLKNIYTTIIYRDIVERYAIRNVRFLEQLTLYLANNTGSLFSAKSISDFLKSQQIKIAPNQVQTYLHHLTSAFLIHDVSRYDIIGKRIFEIGEKYYFENLGIRNAIWGYRLEDKAKILENVVYNHLRYLGYSVKIGVLNSEEIDFVCEKQGETVYLQVAVVLEEQKTIEREFGNLLKIKDNYPKYVITRNGFEGNTYKGIPVMKLIDFLNWVGNN